LTTPPPKETALEVLELVKAGEFQQVSDRLAPPLRPLMPAGAIEAACAAEVSARGQLISAGSPVSEPGPPGAAEVKIPLTFEHGDLTLIATVTDSGWLAGMQLAPASAAAPTAPWEPPGYADPSRLDEREVTVGDGPLAVPGTLTLPRTGASHRATRWCAQAPGNNGTGPRRSAVTSRSRMSPGDWRARAWPCCGSTRSRS